jgi:leucyl aminopeptidase
LIGIIPAVENMPGGNAYRPGDVLTSLSGQTIEVTNTDAEGRLILCDALTYAERFNPKYVIDMATLTGAALVALGTEAHALMGNDPLLLTKLLEASHTSGDRAWQLPLWEEFHTLLDSGIADMVNSSASQLAGSIVGGCFLAKFTKKYSWAHFDIAGTAYQRGSHVATARPLPLLFEFLLHYSAQE